jgi:hypothetical protein
VSDDLGVRGSSRALSSPCVALCPSNPCFLSRTSRFMQVLPSDMGPDLARDLAVATGLEKSNTINASGIRDDVCRKVLPN